MPERSGSPWRLMLTTTQHLPAYATSRLVIRDVHTSVRTYAEDRVAAAQDKVGDELVVRVYGADLANAAQTQPMTSQAC